MLAAVAVGGGCSSLDNGIKALFIRGKVYFLLISLSLNSNPLSQQRGQRWISPCSLLARRTR